MKADLHSHTTCSDGLETPKRVVAAATSIGLDALAFTDHDSIAAARGVASTCLRIIPGAEVAAYVDGQELHLLAYLPTVRDGPLADLLRAGQLARRRRAEAMLQRLQNVGITLDADAILAHRGSIGRPHIADALVLAGKASSRKEAFKRFLLPGGVAFIPRRRLEAGTVLAATHENGGLVSLAHPVQYAAVPYAELMALGLDGLEVDHPSASESQRARLRQVAGTHNLLCTGGSDFHGADSHGDLGSCLTTGQDLERFLARLDR